MNRAITALLATSTGLTVAAPAFAHSGEHSGIHLSEAAAHLLHSPFHLAGIAAGALLVAVIVWKVAPKR